MTLQHTFAEQNLRVDDYSLYTNYFFRVKPVLHYFFISQYYCKLLFTVKARIPSFNYYFTVALILNQHYSVTHLWLARNRRPMF